MSPIFPNTLHYTLHTTLTYFPCQSWSFGGSGGDQHSFSFAEGHKSTKLFSNLPGGSLKGMWVLWTGNLGSVTGFWGHGFWGPGFWGSGDLGSGELGPGFWGATASVFSKMVFTVVIPYFCSIFIQM